MSFFPFHSSFQFSLYDNDGIEFAAVAVVACSFTVHILYSVCLCVRTFTSNVCDRSAMCKWEGVINLNIKCYVCYRVLYTHDQPKMKTHKNSDFHAFWMSLGPSFFLKKSGYCHQVSSISLSLYLYTIELTTVMASYVS